MSTFADLDKPPFYTAVYMDPAAGIDDGLHSDAVSTMLSLAMMLTGFVGFRDDMAAENRRVRIAFWKDYTTMKAWEKTAKDLLPHRITLDDCIASEGCLWRWLDDDQETSVAPMIRAA